MKGFFHTHTSPADDEWDANGIPHAHHTSIQYFYMNKFDEALNWNEKAYELYMGRQGSWHPATIAEKRSRAMILAYSGKVKRAIDDITKTLDECEKQFPQGEPNDEVTLVTKDIRCLVYEIVGMHPTGTHYLSTAEELS